VERLQAEMAELIAENARLRMTPGATAPAAPQPASSPADLGDIAAVAMSVVSDDNKREFGEKLYADVANMFRVVLAHVAPRLIEPVSANVAKLQEETSEQRFWLNVEALCPGAKRINDDASVNGFGTFLNQDLPGMPGVTYREHAEAAAARGDHARMANVVNAFLSSKASPASPPATPPPTPPAGTPPTPPLEALVDPGNAGGGAAPQTPMKVKHSDYVAFMADAASGRLKLTRAQYQQRLNEFNAAIREGRYDYRA
jgi:hypothetical protein